jgi:hypothetical protein
MSDYRIHHHEPGADWQRCERELEAAGVAVPLCHREARARTMGRHRLIAAHDARGRCAAAFAVEERQPRALPGHVLLRAERVGAAVDPPALAAAVEGLARWARDDRGVLGVDVVVFSRDPELRGVVGRQLAGLGFRRVREPQTYPHTSCVDLAGEEAALLSAFSGMARRNIRALEKRPVKLAPITDPRHVGAMQDLVRETRGRTGGEVPRRSLEALIELGRARPELARVVGVFAAADERLLAFATGLAHGDHVTYADAASTRNAPKGMPLGYAPVWDLMRWGKSIGARWFDFGGITTGTRGDGSGDRLAGISDFKRGFNGEVTPISDEWSLVARPGRAAFVKAVTRVAEACRQAAASISPS